MPSLRRKAYKDSFPNINNVDFLAPNSVVIGDVEVGDYSSIWYGATFRGDQKPIKIGKNSILQDLVTVVPRPDGDGVEIGDNVTVAPNVLIQSSKIEKGAFIGMGSTLQHGSKVESYGVLAAGGVLPEKTTIPSYQVPRT